MTQLDRDVHDPLSRQFFEVIVYNAVGRASEVNTYPAFALSHSTGNSGWSTGIVQWDFGQPGRGHKVAELLEHYQAWATGPARFDAGQLASLELRLQRRGQVGNALDAGERSRLNEYLRSGDGRSFVEGLNREQVDYKWERIGQPLAATPWLSGLAARDPAAAVEIATMAAKLFNQNEVRGRRLLSHLQQHPLSPDGTADWIGTSGVAGLTVNARSAILSGRDQARAGAALLADLQYGTSAVSDRWREVVARGDAALSTGFDFNPDLQLFDAMLRNPRQGQKILDAIEGAPPQSPIRIRGINALAREEMADVQAGPGHGLVITTTRSTGYALDDGRWSLARPLDARRAVDLPDHTEGRQVPTTMNSHTPPCDVTARLLCRLYERHGLPASPAELDRLAMALDAQAHPLARGSITHVEFPASHVAAGAPGTRVVAWQGDPADPATPWFTASLEQPLAPRESGLSNGAHGELQLEPPALVHVQPGMHPTQSRT